MDQSYPLQHYPSYNSSEPGFVDHSSPSWSPYSPRRPLQFSLQGAANQGQQWGRHTYQPLNDAYVGYDPSAGQEIQDAQSRRTFLWWLPEIVASVIAMGSLVAIVVVLRTYNGRGLGSVGLPASLTLNGIVAAISTISRVALLVPVASALSQEVWIWFSGNAAQQQQCRSRLKDLDLSDNASRGAWGSLLFLIFAKNRWTARLAAIVTIISLGFGTFTQQLLTVASFEVQDFNDKLAPGNLPRAETWQYFNANPAEFRLTPPLSIRAAIYNGILSNKIDPITVNCPTGNCTWPITPSLAVCGGCTRSGYTQQCDKVVCNYTMPSGYNYSLTNTGDEGVGFIVSSNSYGGVYNGSADNRVYLVHFDVIGASYKAIAGNFDNTNTAASECALWMCVQSYQTQVLAGQVYENVTMSFSDLTVPPYSSETAGFDNYTFASLPAEMNPDPDVTYNVSSIGLEGFYQTLYSLLNGTGFLNIESSAADSDTVDAVWNSSADLSPWIQNVATSMTNALRYDDIHPSPPSRQALVPAPRRSIYDGVGYQLGVRVRWLWLIMPAVCVSLSNLVLAMIMIQTARSPVAPWKSSLLTFLFVGVDYELHQRASGRMSRWLGVHRAVGENKVILKQENDGKWFFKAA